MIEKVSLSEKLDGFTDHWSPKIIGRFEDMHLKVVKLKGEFVWHAHEAEDEVFLVVAGELTIRLRDQEDLVLGPGELAVIPRGVEHCPVAPSEVHVLLIEPATTINTGDAGGERTVHDPEWI
jgi:mannose-6-phosphate isomerase-like protein (cupin superfamily)